MVRTAQYLVDAKRAILLPAGFAPLAELVAAQARDWGATAVGGMTMGADPIACAALAGGADVKAFFVRKEAKAHGLSRRIEGPLLGPGDRCMLVEDVVTTGGSTLRALEALRTRATQVCGVLAICDRLAGGAARRSRRPPGAPYRGADARSTTSIRSGPTDELPVGAALGGWRSGAATGSHRCKLVRHRGPASPGLLDRGVAIRRKRASRAARAAAPHVDLAMRGLRASRSG